MAWVMLVPATVYALLVIFAFVAVKHGFDPGGNEAYLRGLGQDPFIRQQMYSNVLSPHNNTGGDD